MTFNTNLKIKNMKKFNFQLSIFLFATLLVNAAFAQEKQIPEKGERIIMVKKTTDENGKERVETITEKNGETVVKITVDGESVANEDLNGDELVVFKSGKKTYFLREVEKGVDNIDLVFQELEVKLNDVQIPDVRLGVAEADEMNDGEGELGVSLREVETEENGKQVKIVDIFEAGAAEEAGLQKGDIITAIDGKKVKSLSQLMHLIKANEPGESIVIQYLRDGELGETTATLQASKNKNALIFGNGDTRIEWDNEGGISWNGDENFKIKFPIFDNKGEMGMTLGEANDDGVSIKSVETESAAAEAGLQKGDIITEINGKKIKSAAALLKALEGKKDGEELDVKYLRKGEMKRTTVTLKKSNNIFLFKGEDQEIKWEGGDNNWNFNWIEEDGKSSMGVLFGEAADEGVKIEGIIKNSGAEEAGLESGDIVTKVDGERVQSAAEIKMILKDKQAGDVVEVMYLRDETENTVNITLGSKKVMLKKPKDVETIFGNKDNKEGKEQIEMYEEVETPKVAAENRLEFSQLDMYPNPNQGAFTLNFEIEAGAITIRIKDVDGKEVYTEEIPDFNGIFSDRIDISEHPSGVYFLIIEQGDKKMIKKVIYN
jgi:S1-C subfamily serine protease